MTKILIEKSVVEAALVTLKKLWLLGDHAGSIANPSIKDLEEALANQENLIPSNSTELEKQKQKHCDCENKSQCWEPCGELGHSTEHVKVHQQEPATEVVTTELDRFKRMFHAACEALGEINEALGLDPDDGGAEPILDAIAKLQAAQAQGEPKKDLMFSTVAMQERHDERIERTVSTLEHVKQEHGNAEDMYVEMHKHLNCPHCGGSGHIEDVKQEQCEPVGEMTPSRAEMFMTRFKHEEKMLGPNEQAALDYVIAMLVAKQEQGEPVAFLANGVRFKLNFDSKGRVSSLWNYLSELDGRWVALVAAEDDCHLKLTAPQQGTAAPEGWKLVPIEPTDAMLSVWLSTDEIAGGKTGGHMQPWMKAMRLYKAMLAAAPQGSQE